MELSEYELLRIQRIKRNAERLKELGLDQSPLQKAKKPKKKGIFPKVRRVKPGQERRSRRLSSNKKNDVLLMLDYRAKDGEERVSSQNYDNDYENDNDDNGIRGIGTIVRKKFNDEKYYEGEVISYDPISQYYKIKYRDGDEEDYDEKDMKQYKQSKPIRQRARSMRIDTDQWKLSEKDRDTLASSVDDNFMPKFEEFLVYKNKISEQNKRNVMRQAKKLVSGEGIRYESPSYGWPEDCYFKKGEKITPMSDIVELMIEGQVCEDKWGRNHGNGWLIAHPLKKLLLFQQFILNNPDFLTSKLRLQDYCEEGEY